jgi:hypothetical protein
MEADDLVLAALEVLENAFDHGALSVLRSTALKYS